MTEKVIDSADTAMKYLEKDVVITSALLQFKDKGLNLDINHEGVKIILFNRGFKRLLKKKTRVGLEFNT